MMNAKDLRATALAVVTFLIRPFLMLIVGLGIGYGLGYNDSFREADTLGNKVARAVYRVRPEALSEGVRARAAIIRDTVHAKSGLTDIIDSIPPN